MRVSASNADTIEEIISGESVRLITQQNGRQQKRLSFSVLTFESNDFAGRVHDGAVGADRPPDGVGGVGHVDDDHLVVVGHLESGEFKYQS